VLLSSFVGSTVEMYDFLIYGTAASLVFGELFFPSLDSSTALVITFAIFAAGYLTRPIGAIVFGSLGDRIGRKSTLVLTMTIMGTATACIGLLPTASQIGVAAPLILVVLRIVQGFAVGGEWGGAVLNALEHAPDKQRGFASSFANMGGPAGGLLAVLTFLAVTQLPRAQLMSWGWRIPFLLSALLVALGLYVRLRVAESPIFLAAREHAEQTSAHRGAPILDVARRFPGRVALATTASLPVFVYAVFMATSALAIGKDAGLGASTVLSLTACSSVAQIITIGLYARLSDRVGRKPVLLAGCGLSLVLAIPMVMLLGSGRPGLFLLGVMIGSPVIQACIFGPLGAFISERFPTDVRYTATSISYQIGGSIGGLAPFATSLLWAKGKQHFGSDGTGQLLYIGLFLMAVTAVSGLVIARSRETHTDSL
jgi:MHS family shikimate/dehydroshikimate transporter-like MFS transporter